MKKYISILLIMLVLASCGVKNNKDVLTNSGALSNTGIENHTLVESNTGSENSTGVVINTGVIYTFDGKNVENLISAGKSEEALKILDVEYKKDNKNVEALRLLSKLNESEKKNKEALKYILEANEATQGKDKQILYEAGVLYSKNGKITEAKKYIEEALKIDPNYKFAVDYLPILQKVTVNTASIYTFDSKNVENLINTGKNEEALKILESEYKKDNKNVEALRLLSKLKFTQKQNEEALKYSLELNKVTQEKKSQYLYDLGVIYSALGKRKESETYIKKSLKIDPNNKFAQEYLKVIEKLKNGSK